MSAERRRVRIAALAALAAVAGTVLAQPPSGPPAAKPQPAAKTPASQTATKAGGAAIAAEQATPLSNLKDFIHFVKVRRMDLAAGYGQQILDAGLANKDFVKVLDDSGELSRFEEAVALAQRMADAALADTASKLMSNYQRGKLERARDPEEITRNIAMLTGGARARMLARERLVVASEYALPQLLTVFLDSRDKARQAQVRAIFADLGRASVTPLCTALMKLGAGHQESVVDVLAMIPYKASLPYLTDLKETTTSDAVRSACERAIKQLGGNAAGVDRAGLYLQLAEGYYAERNDLTSFPGEEFQLLWSYDPGVGLVMTGIRTPVYHEAMSMRLCERSLTLRSENPGALALWVASNFKRELSTPSGYVNPAYGADRREAMYYAVAAGSEIEQAVLARALDSSDTPLARKAIAALERSAGGATLWKADAGRKPLTEALIYPNRRVQYDAALALAAAQPREKFTGAERVVPTLAGAIREATARVALVLAPDNETYGSVRAILEKAKYSVLPFGRTLGDVAAPLAESAAVDLVVIANQRSEAIPGLIEGVRGTPKVSAAPVLALTSSEAYSELRRRYERDQSVSIRQAALAEATIMRAIDELIQVAAGGPVTEAEARDYSARSLAALRDLAVSASPVFDVGDAALQLMAALGEARGAVRLQVAEVLSRINQERAQTALMDAALGAGGEERVALLGKVADSARRFGNFLPSRQVGELVKLASSGPDAEATAAAALMGALNLSNSRLIPLILREEAGPAARQ